jgi:polar amino acid transport system substrate-binding protein
MRDSCIEPRQLRKRSLLRGFCRMLALLAVAAALSPVVMLASVRADALDAIKTRGFIRVGVKTDYRPFGFQEMSGVIVGLEPDLAADAAKRLGVRLALVPVTTGNRIEKLLDGEIDLIAATMTDTFERRAQVQFIEPLYYSTFVNILLRRDAPVSSWDDISGRTFCATDGAWYNEIIAERFKPALLMFSGTTDPVLALLQGHCSGYLFDQAFILGKTQESALVEKVHMPLRGILRAPWAMAVRPGEERLRQAMESITVSWMEAGTIAELESKWDLPASDYVAAMTARYRKAKP